MRLLLDTHVLLWSQQAPSRLAVVEALLLDPGNELVVSAVSAWEIAIKTSISKLTLPDPVATWVPSRTAALGATPLPITQAHAVAVAELPYHHRDPFDRLLVAQARAAGASIVTADPAFTAYDVDLVAAR